MNPLPLPLFDLTLAAAASAGIGFLSGMFGFGGGFLLVPVLTLALGIPVEVAAGASACQVLGPATTSLMARRLRRDHLRLPLFVSGGLFTGVIVGANLLHSAKGFGSQTWNGHKIEVAEFLVLTIYFLLLSVIGAFSLYEAKISMQGRTLPRGWFAKLQIPPVTSVAELDEGKISIPVLGWFGLGVGMLAGFLGNSGGLVLLPGLVYLLGLPTQRAIRTSMVMVWITSFFATITHAWLGHVQLGLVSALLLGGTIGARLGAEFGLKLTGPQLRAQMATLLLVTAVFIAVKLMSFLT